MQKLSLLLTVGLFALQANAASEPSFNDRVSLAKRVEEQKSTVDYFQNALYPTIGPSLASAMRVCMAHPDARTEKFTVVADISNNGQFTRIAYEPDTNTAACFASAMASFKAPPPPKQESGLFPFVIDMSVVP